MMCSPANKKGNDEDVHTYKSKLFQVENTNNSQMKAQFIWPYKVDYWIIELADDYSYVVVGHPDHKFLFIMSRKPSMDKKLYDEIVARCKAKGYAVEKLTSQNHNG
jgi:apolipoprotein D and lipocalin family protein